MRRSTLLALLLTSVSVPALAAPDATPLVTGPVIDAALAPLAGTVSAAALHAADRGAIDPQTALPHLRLWLNRPANRQAALDALTAAQTDRHSPSFRHWLKPADLGATYGPAATDIAAVTAWLARHGFTVHGVAPTGTTVDFSGTAGQVAEAFHTAIHQIRAGTETHRANLAEPAIPAALSGIVQGISLNDFAPKPLLRSGGLVTRKQGDARWHATPPSALLTIANPNGGNFYAVTPADFLTIYGAPANSTLVSGAGIAVLEDSDMLIADFDTFQQDMIGFNLSTATIVHPGCTDPGLNGDEPEAALDAEWAGSVARSTPVTVAACAASGMTDGVAVAFENLVEQGTDAFIVSISYGLCEQALGLGFLREWQKLTQEAAAEGLSVLVASGDNGPAGCEDLFIDIMDGSPASTGRAVNGLAASPYVTAVGGTDFDDTATNTIPRYWNTTANTDVLTVPSALSYIPEIPWDDSCASRVIAKYDGIPASPLGACGSPLFGGDSFPPIATSSGTSSYYARPTWQRARGVPNTPYRVLPDVAFFAGDGLWDHFLLFCDTGPFGSGGVPCAHGGTTVTYLAGGGTSFAAPAFASIVAGHFYSGHGNTPVGNLGPILYGLAREQFGNTLLESDCGSRQGTKANPLCVFRSIDIGNNAVPCFTGTPDCPDAGGGEVAVIRERNGKRPAFPARLDYNQATGLGSVNINNFWTNFY